MELTIKSRRGLKTKINKTVITAGGLGTRLLPCTKEHPKEMFPLFSKNEDGDVVVKPLLQIVFEQLQEFGIENFCFIVGRGKRSIEEHFTPDDTLLKLLESGNKIGLYKEMKKFHDMLEKVDITWKTQLRPKGFGDAVLKSKSFIQNDTFLLFAGDDFIISENNDFLRRLVDTHDRHNASATIVVERAPDPERYGVVYGSEVEEGTYKVEKIVEKPKNPESNLCVVGVYVFSPKIFECLEENGYNENGQKELTSAIQLLLEKGFGVYAEELKPNEIRMEIGTPNSYRDTLNKSYEIL